MDRNHCVRRGLDLAALSIAACLSTGLPVRAENHALILWIGEYADERANLQGIDRDAAQARTIAAAMGVPPHNIVEISNRGLSLQGMSAAINGLTNRIKDGDNVFMYYSGHGAQKTALAGANKKCSEGIVAHDLQLYYDQAIESDLARLAAKARQVVMLNDSCFSGGAAEKSVPGTARSASSSKSPMPKVLPVSVKAPAAGEGVEQECGTPVNKGLLQKNLAVVAAHGAQLLYVAAAQENELAWATSEGSLATQAWAWCLSATRTDSDRSGSISGEELRQCAQAFLDDKDRNTTGKKQTIKVTGKSALPMSFAAAPDAARLNAPRTLEDLQALASPSIEVNLIPAKNELRIGQDELAFSVKMGRAGYLYILYVGSDGKTIDLLFPNDVDNNNQLSAGVHQFPRSSWRIQATGPAGTDHLLAMISPTPMDFSQHMRKSGVFASTPATLQGAKNLRVEGRYGASQVVSLREVQ